MSIILFYLAPLPIFIAAMGWHHRAGLIAAAAATVTLAFVSPLTAFIHLLTVALPAWWLSYLALLARTDDQDRTEWYPIGRLMVWICGLAIALTTAILFAAIQSFGSLTALLSALATELHRALASVPGSTAQLPPDVDLEDVANGIAPLIPAFAAAIWTIVTVFNLWLAARIARLSGRLVRPWPDIAGLRLPTAMFVATGLLMTLLVLGIPLGGLPGIVAMSGFATLNMMLLMTGLAVAHHLTRGQPLRMLALILIYVLLVSIPLVSLLLVLLAFADHLFKLRERKDGAPPAST